MPNVLIVEDSKLTLKIHLQILSGYHCDHIYIAQTYHHARQVLKSHADQIDLAIVDYDLQEKRTGLDFIKCLRKNKHTQSIPVVMITAHDEIKIKRKCEKLKVVGCYIKGHEQDKAYRQSLQEILEAHPDQPTLRFAA